MTRTARLAAHGTVSAHLATLGDRRLGALLDRAAPVGSGIGGTRMLLDVGGVPVFVKKIPLTDLERRPENVMSTANVFGLPAFFHYGIGSPGFGVWRELAVHTMTTGWVLGNEYQGFPLMYHWRVLPEASPSVPEELSDVEGVVEYWEGSPAVRARVEAIERSSAVVVLFLECLPQSLHEWLGARVADGGPTDGALTMVEDGLRAGTSFMNARGLLHFDAHFANILTDGRRLYFTDFGLAISSRFALSPEECEFLTAHLTYDRDYTATHLVNWLVTALHGGSDPMATVRRCARGEMPPGLSETAAKIVMRHAPLAAIMNDFYRELQTQSRTTPYPTDLAGSFTGDVQHLALAVPHHERLEKGAENRQ